MPLVDYLAGYFAAHLMTLVFTLGVGTGGAASLLGMALAFRRDERRQVRGDQQ
jgi:hypothetical protein